MSFETSTWYIKLIRHATLLLEIDDARILVDPMLSPKDAMDPVANAGNDIRIPMVDLPLDENQLNTMIHDVDAILVTHTHRDHWDAVAQKMIDKSKPIFCQPDDLGKIKGQGFVHVFAIEDSVDYNDFTIHRTPGRHGTGEIREKMGTVSGYVIRYADKSLYIAGDTIWCAEVNNVLKKFKPQMIVVNAGGAQFLTGDAITMTAEDVASVSISAPNATVVAVHMDTVNHCKVTRDVLRKFVAQNNLTRIQIPDDGATLTF